MFIELVDSLRCLTPHEDAWLVAAVSRMDGRHIVEGMLGCPVCRREYPVRDGVGWFGPPPPTGSAPSIEPRLRTTDADRIARAAALLALMDPGGIVVLGGDWVECAEALVELGPAHVVVLDGRPSPDSRPQISSLAVADRLPFAAGAVRGIALGHDRSDASGSVGDALLASATAALRTRGRLVAPYDTSVPADVTELARDGADWVAERRAVASPPITLRSARR